MSQQEEGLASIAKALIVLFLAIGLGPLLVAIALAFIFEPRTGSWGAWPHIIGGGWFVLWAGYWLFELVRSRN